MTFQVEHIVACDDAGGIGKDGKLPWDNSADLKRFKEMTMGHICVMGRRTYQEINARTNNAESVLPGRQCFVVSNSPDFKPTNATVIPEWGQVDKALIPYDIKDEPRPKVFVIGGARLFNETLSSCSTVHITHIAGTHQCDTFYPVHVLLKAFDGRPSVINGLNTSVWTPKR